MFFWYSAALSHVQLACDQSQGHVTCDRAEDPVSISLHRLNPGSVIFEVRYIDSYTPIQPSHVKKKGLGGTEANRGDLESLPPERDTKNVHTVSIAST